MRVKALKQGYYGHKRIKPGEEFELKSSQFQDGSPYPAEKQFSSSWMEKLDSSPSTSHSQASKEYKEFKELKNPKSKHSRSEVI
jgi:hypothetical protein